MKVAITFVRNYISNSLNYLQFVLSGDFVTGGDPEKCDETKSLYCVTKMKVLPNNSIVEAEFFCDLTTQNSACSEESLSSCSEMLNVSASETRERICCCSSTECNLPQYMLRSDPVTDTPFPGKNYKYARKIQ